ncbi:MAG TPA: DUF427 domain-containing protein [Longimicrobium sp.]|nr:DUF427 domain-containing protein [Longimicrobium sp.]
MRRWTRWPRRRGGSWALPERRTDGKGDVERRGDRRERRVRGSGGKRVLSRGRGAARAPGGERDHTVCPWKGTASYYTVVVDGKENPDAAWYYPDPKPAASNVAGHVAFWRGVTVER